MKTWQGQSPTVCAGAVGGDVGGGHYRRWTQESPAPPSMRIMIVSNRIRAAGTPIDDRLAAIAMGMRRKAGAHGSEE